MEILSIPPNENDNNNNNTKENNKRYSASLWSLKKATERENVEPKRRAEDKRKAKNQHAHKSVFSLLYSLGSFHPPSVFHLLSWSSSFSSSASFYIYALAKVWTRLKSICLWQNDWTIHWLLPFRILCLNDPISKRWNRKTNKRRWNSKKNEMMNKWIEGKPKSRNKNGKLETKNRKINSRNWAKEQKKIARNCERCSVLE